jgi:flagellar biosynthesis chaperone FliJ
MKRFRFALDGLIRVREQEVRDQQIRLAGAARFQEEARRRRDERIALLSRTMLPASVRVDIAEMAALEEDRAALRRQLRRDEETLALCTERLREEQRRLEHANQRKEAVVELRQRRYLEFMRQVMRNEQKEHDEIASRLGRAA